VISIKATDVATACKGSKPSIMSNGFIIDPPPSPNRIEPIPIAIPREQKRKQLKHVYSMYPELIFSNALCSLTSASFIRI